MFIGASLGAHNNSVKQLIERPKTPEPGYDLRRIRRCPAKFACPSVAAEGGQDLLDATLELTFKVRRHEAQHWHGASGVDIRLDFLDHRPGGPISQPKLGPLLGNGACAVV